MSCEVKRVPADFSWPMNEVWSGYINHHIDRNISCTSCEGTGNSPEVRALEDAWWGNTHFDLRSMIMNGDRAMTATQYLK